MLSNARPSPSIWLAPSTFCTNSIRVLPVAVNTRLSSLVIHGHGHEERIDRLQGADGPMLVVAVPSASYDAPGRAGWNQYRISGETGAWRLDLEARRSSVDGYVTTMRETVWWAETVSRAVAPRSR